MTSSHTPWWGKIGLLWLLFVPFCLALYVLIQPLAPHDFWYHLRAGAWMVTHRSIPQVALFTPSVPPGTPYFYQSWISEVALYLLFQQIGLAGLQTLRALLFAGCFALFMLAALHRTKVLLRVTDEARFNKAARLVSLCSLAGLFLCIPNLDLRPQIFSWAFFAIFALILFSWAELTGKQLRWRALVLVILMALWANTHGAFATGLILLAALCGGETLHFFAGKRFSSLLGNALTREQLRWIWLALVGSLVAACLNPRGVGIYAYVMELTGNAINIKFNLEWQPPTWSDDVHSLFFYCGMVIVVLVVLLAVRFRTRQTALSGNDTPYGFLGLRPSELLMALLFFVMALRSVRSIIWFGLLSIIFFTALVCRAFPPRTTKVLLPSRTAHSINAALAICICASLIPFLPRLKPHLPWPDAYRQRFATTPQGTLPAGFEGEPQMLLSSQTPVGAALFLRKSPPRGLLWNDMVLGSYLVWALYPERGPWADPRIELRPDSFWHQYMDTSHAEGDVAALLAQRGFSDVLINKEVTFQQRLTKALRKSPLWTVAYQDRATILFRWHGK